MSPLPPDAPFTRGGYLSERSHLSAGDSVEFTKRLAPHPSHGALTLAFGIHLTADDTDYSDNFRKTSVPTA